MDKRGRIRKVKDLLRRQEEIQKWHRRSGREKNPNIQKTIAFGYAVLDFLYYGECRVHKAQMNNYMFFGNCGNSAIKCIEDIHNYKVQSFINKIRKIAFSDYNQWVAFTTHPSRRKIIVSTPA